MDRLFSTLSYVTLCPMALLYLFLLDDQWRVSRRWKGTLMLLSTLLPLALPPLLMPLHAPLILYGLIPWLPVVAAVLWASRVRDWRLLFTLLSASLLVYLTNSAADKLALHTVLPGFAIRVVMDGVLLFLCAKFYRPIFLSVFHTAGREWPALCLLPLTLWGVYLLMMNYPDYSTRAQHPQAQIFTLCLLLIALVLYIVIFSFFKRLVS